RQQATTLSGGEAQRLALARAMILEPELFLLDEPTANLDPANVGLMEELLKEIKTKGTTIIMVTHNLFQAKRLADEVLFLYEGKLIETGQVEQLFSSPEHELTKAFINGEMVW
ncbi:MAG TPA: ATP-binding cassette domain-containing protein, partial [Clostridia bacterium]|nr:ATP-binding cassette domain-containing protein [Clostridia bacterium]